MCPLKLFLTPGEERNIEEEKEVSGCHNFTTEMDPWKTVTHKMIVTDDQVYIKNFVPAVRTRPKNYLPLHGVTEEVKKNIERQKVMGCHKPSTKEKMKSPLLSCCPVLKSRQDQTMMFLMI